MSKFPKFYGNCPRNVAKDAKYRIKSGEKGPVVALTFRTMDDERWYMATEDHPELVKMVNQVKLDAGQPPNGSFYINEFKQVIVPAAGSSDYWLGGKYEKSLRFEFENKVISGEAVDLDGLPLSPGDNWVGPHPGIPYILTAGGNDIKYTMSPRPNVEKDVKLSKQIGADAAKEVASRIRAIKGFSGGRFYVNEFGSIFTPMKEGWDTNYIYIGQLNFEKWFPISHSEPE